MARRLVGLVVLTACVATTDPQNAERSRRQLALASSMYNDQNDVPGALATLETALELDPGNAEAHVLLGYIELGLGNTEEAETA
ncbi:MAG: tetratricopeptide repeat protein, partial [Myxococcota bacterium]